MIKIDDEVYSLLQANAKPFVDTENSTLRRMLGLDRPTQGTRPDSTIAMRNTTVTAITGNAAMENNAGDASEKIGEKIPATDPTIDDLLAEIDAMPNPINRTKAPKADLLKLVRSGRLQDRELLYLVDYQNTRVKNYQASVDGKDLQFEGRTFSMSSLARELLQKEGYMSDSVRGPSHWAKANGTTITELWEDFLSKQRKS
ncbi:hypothetical protein [Paraburkholderia steynii]|uniref:hypothetical protein n=1 Tax=Paraburkholderia steynii TaxID=1245441 RepID=UPI00115FE82D|nr:hypothetical protein [Paraburkholderia steynii]